MSEAAADERETPRTTRAGRSRGADPATSPTSLARTRRGRRAPAVRAPRARCRQGAAHPARRRPVAGAQRAGPHPGVHRRGDRVRRLGLAAADGDADRRVLQPDWAGRGCCRCCVCAALSLAVTGVRRLAGDALLRPHPPAGHAPAAGAAGHRRAGRLHARAPDSAEPRRASADKWPTRPTASAEAAVDSTPPWR